MVHVDGVPESGQDTQTSLTFGYATATIDKIIAIPTRHNANTRKKPVQHCFRRADRVNGDVVEMRSATLGSTFVVLFEFHDDVTDDVGGVDVGGVEWLSKISVLIRLNSVSEISFESKASCSCRSLAVSDVEVASIIMSSVNG